MDDEDQKEITNRSFSFLISQEHGREIMKNCGFKDRGSFSKIQGVAGISEELEADKKPKVVVVVGKRDTFGFGYLPSESEIVAQLRHKDS